MKLLILNDVHSNLEALDAVLEDAWEQGPFDAKASAGDIVGYGPNPVECIDRMRKERFLVTQGNHDLAIGLGMYSPKMNDFSKAAGEDNSKLLTPRHREYLLKLPLVRIGPEGKFSVAHGSFAGKEFGEYLERPHSVYVTDEESALAAMQSLHTKLGIIGHTHLPMYASGLLPEEDEVTIAEFSFEESRERGLSENDRGLWQKVTLPFNGVSVEGKEKHRRRILFNPGSVGQPRDGCSRAAYGIIEIQQDEITLQFRDVEYDIEKTQRKILDAGLPEYLADRLGTGL